MKLNCIVLMVILSSLVFSEEAKMESRALLHNLPNVVSDHVGVLEVESKINVIDADEEGNWLKVEDEQGKVGWVEKHWVSPLNINTGLEFQNKTVLPVHREIHDGINPVSQFGNERVNSNFAIVNQGYNFYFGNLHSHTAEDSSEGLTSQSTHEDAFEYAMDDNKGNLDFLAVTPHTHLVKDNTYQKLLVTVSDANYYKPGKFVPIAGQEYSSISKGNHINVFELDKWIDPSIVKNGEFDKLFDEFIPNDNSSNVFAQFNHPKSNDFTGSSGREYGRDDYDNIQSWVDATDKFVQAIEIVSAPSHRPDRDNAHFDQNGMRVKAWLWALSKGWHIGPTANQDNHHPNWGDASDSRTVAISKSLTRENIIDAFQNRRFYATEDSTIELTFRSGENWMGSIIDLNDFSGFQISVNDPEEINAEYIVSVYRGFIGSEPVQMGSRPILLETVGAEELINFSPSEIYPDSYYFVHVEQSLTDDDPNGTKDDAWSSPVWIRSDE